MKKIIYLILVMLVTLFWACEPEIEEFEPSAGSADFTTYVALGNSLTAGFADAALYRSAQQVAFPKLMAKQFSYVGGGDFKQPLILDEVGLGARLVLGISANCQGQVGLGPISYPGTSDPGNLIPIGTAGPYQNLGVPGAKVSHLLADGYGLQNLFFGRFASNPLTASIIGDAMAQQPTFFSLWIGNNDVLGYALAGGEYQDSLTNNPITDVTAFNTYYNHLLDQLTANGAKGAIANIPDVTSIPFFTTVPYNALPITSQDDADALTAAYGAMGFNFDFHLGANALVIQDPTAPGMIRQATADDLILLSIPQDSIRCAGWGSMAPVPHSYVLDALETAKARNAINAFNLKIQEAAAAKGLAYVDLNQVLRNIESGIMFDGVEVTTQFVSGGGFSLDGVHLTGKGNAIVANSFIEAINDSYGAEIPKVLVNDYNGVLFP